MEVDFLHRTVRDFLYTPTVYAKYVAVDSKAFNADAILLRALVARVKAFDKSSPMTAQDDVRLWNFIQPALHYARMAEKRSGEPQTPLLDELDNAASSLYDRPFDNGLLGRIGSHWSTTQQSYKADLRAASFLTLAIVSGLENYVQDKLDDDGQPAGRNLATPLLFFAFSNTFAKMDFDQPNPSMIRILLEHNADPNLFHRGMTIWERLLLAVTTNASEPWLKAVQLFILHRADLTVNIVALAKRHCVELPEGSKSLQTHLKLAFPRNHEASPTELEQLLEEKLEQVVLTPSSAPTIDMSIPKKKAKMRRLFTKFLR
jgi:hypothetical protein